MFPDKTLQDTNFFISIEKSFKYGILLLSTENILSIFVT